MSVIHRDEVREMSLGASRLRGMRLSMCLEGAISGSMIRCSSPRYVPIPLREVVEGRVEVRGGGEASDESIGVAALLEAPEERVPWA